VKPLIVVLLLTLMGWGAVTYPKPQPTPVLIDKVMVKIRLAEAIERYTQETKLEMESRIKK
jgi:hypothetical protein